MPEEIESASEACQNRDNPRDLEGVRDFRQSARGPLLTEGQPPTYGEDDTRQANGLHCMKPITSRRQCESG